jgi:transposase
VGSAAWRKAFYLFKAHRDEYLALYHKRSNVKAVFSAIKRKFGEHVRSRTPVAQVNEILAKLICYDLTVVVHEMFENGIAPSFGAAPVKSNSD